MSKLLSNDEPAAEELNIGISSHLAVNLTHLLGKNLLRWEEFIENFILANEEDIISLAEYPDEEGDEF